MTDQTETSAKGTAIKLTIGGTTKRSKFSRELALTIPATSLDFLIHYGAKQFIADGAAGAETEADFNAGIDERVRKIVESDFSRSAKESAGPSDDVETVATKLASDAVREAAKANKAKLSKEDFAAMVKGIMDTQGDAYRTQAKSNIAFRKGLAAKIDLSAGAAKDLAKA